MHNGSAVAQHEEKQLILLNSFDISEQENKILEQTQNESGWANSLAEKCLAKEKIKWKN